MANEGPGIPAADFSRVTRARYIKLGAGGEYDRLCLEDGTLRLGFHSVPASYSPEQGLQPLFDHFHHGDRKKQVASSYARQVRDFYAAGPETLWITFAKSKMWWCQAEGPVEFLSHDPKASVGSRLRRTVSGWHDVSILGKVLYMSDVSGLLTKTARFQGTICDIRSKDFEYLMRLLRGQRLIEVDEAQANKKALLVSIERLLQRLTWIDFEILIDLIFSHSGWQRVGAVGGTQKTIDLELTMPLTGERALVQVKSSTNQQQLDDYIERFKDLFADKKFYIYHTSSRELACDPDHGIKLIGPAVVAEQVLQAGLTDWLIEKVG